MPHPQVVLSCVKLLALHQSFPLGQRVFTEKSGEWIVVGHGVCITGGVIFAMNEQEGITDLFLPDTVVVEPPSTFTMEGETV